MKTKELRWLVEEIVRLNSILKREDTSEDKREQSYAEIKERYLTLEQQYNNLKEVYEGLLQSNFAFQEKCDALERSIKNYQEVIYDQNKEIATLRKEITRLSGQHELRNY
jgi:chromosome segregation ATPase